jgi:hypothetical protein
MKNKHKEELGGKGKQVAIRTATNDAPDFN